MNALDTESEHQIVGGLGRKELDESAPAKDDTPPILCYLVRWIISTTQTEQRLWNSQLHLKI